MNSFNIYKSNIFKRNICPRILTIDRKIFNDKKDRLAKYRNNASPLTFQTLTINSSGYPTRINRLFNGSMTGKFISIKVPNLSGDLLSV